MAPAPSPRRPRRSARGAAPNPRRRRTKPLNARASAPGRVNLIGEHTDYNGGFVLPTTIPQQTHASLTPRSDRTIRVHTTNAPELDTEWQQYTLAEERRTRTWLDYVQGLTWVLHAEGFELPTGFDLKITSEVPLGAGLSSSAALEVAVLRAIRQEFALDLDDVKLALLGQRAENDFVGARCGIMDQMAASLADASSALFLDTRSLEYRRVALPAEADLVVIHSGVEHEISGGDYNTRRAECEEAARLLGVPQLRDLTAADAARVNALPEPLNRRARHVMTEDARVLTAITAMEADDLQRLGRLFAESHASMRDDFEVSVPDVDRLVDLAQADPDVFGARLTGGGFGGSIVALTRAGTGRAVAERVARAYAARAGREPSVLVPPSQDR
ncbi:MAG: galactokinase [Chloroflexi bacterium]|nr:galactokinase [Chloroflexota bacterium]